MISEELQRLLDKDALHDLMARYVRGVDRSDWDALRATYHPDAYDDHGDYQGGVDGFIEHARTRTGPIKQMMHILGSSLIEFASKDVAIMETYFSTAHTLPPEVYKVYGTEGAKGLVQYSQYGRYCDRCERRNGEWRFAKRFVVFEALRLSVGEVPPIKPEWAQQDRGQKDPIFKLRTEAGLKELQGGV
jgi:hypothetical protein